jgi:hypothetical protein
MEGIGGLQFFVSDFEKKDRGRPSGPVAALPHSRRHMWQAIVVRGPPFFQWY